MVRAPPPGTAPRSWRRRGSTPGCSTGRRGASSSWPAPADGDGPPLTFTGHLDTVPVDADAWSADPYGAERDGDKVVGRGTSDMKSGVAAAVVATAEHVARPHTCRGVQLVLTAGEETGCTGLLGLDAAARAALATGGPLVVAEPTANELVLGHKGAHWMRLTATGRAAHGSAPELGDNAVVRLARAAVALHDHRGWPRHDRFGPVTANVGVLRGGVAPNVVPDTAELLLDVRTVPGVAVEQLRTQVGVLAGERVEVADHVVLPPLDTPPTTRSSGSCGRRWPPPASTTGPGRPPGSSPTPRCSRACWATDGAAAPSVVLGPGRARAVPRRGRVLPGGARGAGHGGVPRAARTVVRLERLADRARSHDSRAPRPRLAELGGQTSGLLASTRTASATAARRATRTARLDRAQGLVACRGGRRGERAARLVDATRRRGWPRPRRPAGARAAPAAASRRATATAGGRAAPPRSPRARRDGAARPRAR